MVDHRTYVAWRANPWDGDADGKDVLALLQEHGLRPEHSLLDFGCGSLRVGRWLIEYLLPERYFGIDPNLWLVAMAKEEEIPSKVWAAKRPIFSDNGEFDLTVFGQRFDYVLVSDMFAHAAHNQIARVLAQLPKVLKPDGLCLANIVPMGDTDYEGQDWLYPGIAPHGPNCIMEPAEAAGLRHRLAARVHRGTSDLLWFLMSKGTGS